MPHSQINIYCCGGGVSRLIEIVRSQEISATAILSSDELLELRFLDAASGSIRHDFLRNNLLLQH